MTRILVFLRQNGLTLFFGLIFIALSYEADPGSDEEQKVGYAAEMSSPRSAAADGLRQVLFSHSLLIVMGVIFVLRGWPSP